MLYPPNVITRWQNAARTNLPHSRSGKLNDSMTMPTFQLVDVVSRQVMLRQHNS